MKNRETGKYVYTVNKRETCFSGRDMQVHISINNRETGFAVLIGYNITTYCSNSKETGTGTYVQK
jgi:hypothetical protein